MAFSKEIQREIYNYCNNHLADEEWYETEFFFIKDEDLRKRLVEEFKAIRFAYKLYEGIEAREENLIFEVRNQILAYATIYEAVIEEVLNTYYSDTAEYHDLMYSCVPIPISIPTKKREELGELLEHDGKEIYTFYYGEKKKDAPKVRFDDKCLTAEKLGIIHKFLNKKSEEIDLPREIIEIYNYRNGIHLIAERRKKITYEIDLSKKAYRRMRPFIDQIKERLQADGKI